MDSITFNAVLLPLYATFIIPSVIRIKKSGEYRGFCNIQVYLHLAFLIALESYFYLSKFGFGPITVLRILGTTALPFIGAYVFVKYSHKSLYGEEFSRHKKKSS